MPCGDGSRSGNLFRNLSGSLLRMLFVRSSTIGFIRPGPVLYGSCGMRHGIVDPSYLLAGSIPCLVMQFDRAVAKFCEETLLQ